MRSHCLVAISLLAASASLPAFHAATTDDPVLSGVEPVFRLKGKPGEQRLLLREQLANEKLTAQVEDVAFQALPPTNSWPGLVPLFGVERDGRFELRRRPPRGQEAFTDPFFYALPLPDETDAARLAGRWQCTATRNGSESWFVWELTMDGTNVAGRFDAHSDYRVAHLTGGAFHSNRLTLMAEYFMDRYEISGQWRDGAMSGQWRRTDDSENGIWRATREGSAVTNLPALGPVPLHEFRRASDETRRYSTAPLLDEPGWVRVPRPLGLVWPAPAQSNAPPRPARAFPP